MLVIKLLINWSLFLGLSYLSLELIKDSTTNMEKNKLQKINVKKKTRQQIWSLYLEKKKISMSFLLSGRLVYQEKC